MIFIMLFWVYAAALFYLYGLLFVKILNKILKTKEEPSFWILLWLGLIGITIIVAYASLFTKIGVAFHLSVVLIGIAYLLFDYKYIKNATMQFIRKLPRVSTLIIIFFIVSSSTVLVFSAREHTVAWRLVSYDTAFYHLQTVKWTKEYRAVPGIGNLHWRLAYNSFWFLSQAFFDISIFNSKSFYVLSGFIIILMIGTCFSGINKLSNKKMESASFIKALLLFSLVFLIRLLPSSSNDAPAGLLIFTVFLLSIENIKRKRNSHFYDVLIIILCLFAITIKLSTFPLVLIAGYFAFNLLKKKDKKTIYKNALILAALSLIILAPWFSRYVILSGYLVYPFPQIDIFDVDWKIPLEEVKIDAITIENWAKKGKVITRKISFDEWIWPWLKQNLTNSEFLKLLGVSSFLFLISIFINFKFCLKYLKKYWILYLAAVLGMLFWFFKAPAIRFGFGFITILSSLLILPFVKSIAIQKKYLLNKSRHWRQTQDKGAR